MIRNFLCKLLRDARTVFSMVYRLLRWDWQTLFLFEFIYRLCMLAIVIPLLKNVLQWAIELGGLKVLSQYGILTLIQRPWCIPVLLLLGVVVVFFEFIELTMIIHYFDAAQKQERVTLRILWERSWRQTMRICQPKNICMLLFVAFIIPLTDLTFGSSLLSIMKIPGFVSDYLLSKGSLKILYGVLVGLCILICYRWIFCLHEYTIREKNFAGACRESIILTKGRTIRIALVSVEWRVLLAAIGYVVYFLVMLVSAVGIRLLWEKQQEVKTFWSWYDIVGHGKAVVSEGVSVVASYAWISAAWYYIRKKREPEIQMDQPKGRLQRPRRAFWYRMAALGIVFGSCVYMAGAGITYGETAVCAHRGTVNGMPENTLISLQRLVQDHTVTSAEIDVRQLKDGTLILLHDDNFKRVAGVNRKVWDVTYEEALEYDVGSYCGEEWAGTRISTLEEVLDYIEYVADFKLVIELKNAGRQEGLEEQVVSMILERGLEERCIIASMNYEILQRVKAADSRIATQLITFIAYGKLYTLEDADSYSVEASFVTKRLAVTLRSMGKPLYVWTVNKEKELKRLAGLPIDCIITDEAYWVDYALSSPIDNRLIYRAVQAVLGDMK